MFFKELERIDADPVELGHSHAGIAGPSSIRECFADFEVEVVRCAEVGLFQFFFTEQTRQKCVLVDPISNPNLNVLNMNIHRVKDTSIREMVLDDDGSVGKLTENLHNPTESKSIDLFVEISH